MKREILMAALGLAGASSLAEGNVTRAAVDALLGELAAKPAPTTLAPAAMCYDMAMPPERTEYVCPACGAKTLYAKPADARTASWTAESYRNGVKRLKALGLNATLDESFLCDACRKQDQPRDFYLEITVDGRVSRNAVLGHDFALLAAFLAKKNVWVGDFGEEHPLKEEMPRIRKLLGIPEPTPKAP